MLGLDSDLAGQVLPDADSIKNAEVTVNVIEEESDRDSDDESGSSSKKKPRITERKRQMLAAFEDLAAQEVQKCLEEDDALVKQIDNNLLTTRGLISKFESDHIINNKREYQTELFERATRENIIAVLPTGSGKTLIAALLLEHTIAQELENRKAGQPRRISFFLVEVATLVLQQGSVLEKNLPTSVARFCGEMNVDSFSKAQWKDHFDNNMIIVLTAEILRQCLAHGFITMPEINLLIFDEAHHTKKNHPYARIIRDFYEPTPKARRPRIFGTTASPVDAKVDAIQATRDLEAVLHAKIATVKDPSQLIEYVNPPEEFLSRYHPPRKPYGTNLAQEISALYPSNQALMDLVSRSRVLTAELGEWCGDRFLAMSVLGEEGDKLERKAEQRYAGNAHSRAVFDEELQAIKNSRDIVEITLNRRGVVIPELSSPDLSNKVLRLKEILDDSYDASTETRCIVFVERRNTARMLLEIFRHHAHPNLRPSILIGSQQSSMGDQKVSIREQLRAMNAFKDGKINCLFATSVAEEGLDIPLCNLVIRFDLYKTMIQYMQSRGRARHKNSKYVSMLENGNSKHLSTYREVRNQERLLHSFCELQPADRILENADADFDPSLLKDGVYEEYTEPLTGAKLTFGTVLAQLGYFAACIPRVEEVPSKLEFMITTRAKSFVCEVILPQGSPLTSCIGKEYPRKSLAKRSAAFEACMRLRRDGLLDEHLLPIYHKQLPLMRNAKLALQSKTGKSYDLVVKPKFWEQGWGIVPSDLFVLVMKADNPEVSEHPIEPMLMLTRQRLPTMPTFPVYPKPGVRLNMSLTPLVGTIQLSQAELQALNTFSLRILKDAFNKGYEDNLSQTSYWLAPMNMEYDHMNTPPAMAIINWSTVNFVQANEAITWTMQTPPRELENRFWVDPGNGGHRYYSAHYEPSMKATDSPPEGVVKKPCMDSIVDWTSSLWKKSRYKVVYDPNQPVLRAYKLPLRRNWLDDWDDEDLAEKTTAWICPQPLKISAIPLPNVVMGYIVPALVWRIDAYLVALEACAMLGLSVNTELALEAVTKDSDNTEEHRDEQVQFQRGMGKNYERLEFIGDAFLKMATSISLYANKATDDEYHSHVNRMVMICNANLFTHAIENKLYQYIRAEGFNRRTWYPEGLILKEGKGAEAKKKTAASTGPDGPNKLKHDLRTHNLNDKTIADVCEALIGASLLSEKEKNCMDMAVRAVTVLVKNENHVAYCWDDYYKQYKIPSYQIAEVSAAQEDVARQVENLAGHKFKHPRLLASAFTHPSWPSYKDRVPNYQRLEFLGDSLLDMACVNFLFHRHPDRDPQWLTEHKMAMVSNRFLGALCVRLKFNKFLKKNSMALITEIKNYVDSIEEAEAESNGARDYWTTAIDPPKCLPDLVEAYLGAMFVDSCFNYSVIEDFFEKHIRWYFEDMSIYDTFANNHPTTFLNRLLVDTFHCDHYSVQTSELPSPIDGGPPRILAGVLVHFKAVAKDISGSSKYAKVRASKKAIDELEKLSLEQFREKFGCNCKVKMDKIEARGMEAQITQDSLGTAI